MKVKCDIAVCWWLSKVEQLLCHGADQFVVNKQQRSVLDVACEFGHSSVSSRYSVACFC